MSVAASSDLSHAIALAVNQAIDKLFKDVNESFYYVTLLTTGEGLAPCVAAWSWEALEREILKADDPQQARDWLKWSWADSPYLAYGDEFFGDVKDLFLRRKPIIQVQEDAEQEDAEQEDELQFLLASMENALDILDSKGLFGSGEKRSKIIVNAEVFPPDHTNAARAVRLNPPGELLNEWMRECAEPEL